MKASLFICVLLLIPSFVLPENSSYDYSSYTASSTNSNLSGQSISSSNSGQSAVYITQSGITISESTITKSGDISGSVESCEFYVLMQQY